MKSRAAQAGLLIALLAILWVPPAAAQVQVAPSTYIRLTADASVGYVHSNARDELNSIGYGFRADLNGFFYHPNFLSFDFSPYYNQGREYSSADFISGDKGFATNLNLFSGSHIPFYLNYSKSKTDSGLYGVTGTEANVVGAGTNDNLNINWNVRFPRWPSLQLGYLRSSNDYRVFGENASFGTGRSRGYVVGAQYQLAGFALTGSFVTQNLRQSLPQVLIGPQTRAQIQTGQDLYQFSATRRLLKAAFFDLTATRSRWDTDATGQSQNRRYDTISTGLSARPAERLSAGFRFHYTTDLNALLLGSILPGGLGSQGGNPQSFLINASQFRSRFMTSTGHVSYELNRNISVRSSLRRGDGHFSTRSGSSNTAWDNALTLRGSFHGARLNAGYTTGIYDFADGPAQTSSQGHTGNFGVAKMIRGWDYSGAFQYSTSSVDAFLPGNTETLTAEFNVSGHLKTWRLITGFRYENSDSIFNTETQNRRSSVRLGLTRGRLNLNSQLQFMTGLSILAVSGPRPASLQEIAAAGSDLEKLLIPTESSSFSFNGSYQIGRRTTMHGGWVRMNYLTFQQSGTRENHLDQLDFHIRHRFRLLDVRTGYRGYRQHFVGLNGQYNANTFYFQVSRHFDVF